MMSSSIGEALADDYEHSVFDFDYESPLDFEGRTIAFIYNASTIAQYSTIALGVFFLVTALLLIAYYLSSLDSASSGGSYGRRWGGAGYEGFHSKW